MTSLTGDNLACDRGGRRVFSGLSFQVSSGEGLLITGPNGTGKTTLLRAVCGLSELSAGRLWLEGQQDDLAIGQRCHLVAHADAIKPAFSVAENLAFWAAFNAGGDVAAALAAFDLVPLAGYSAGLLSAGQRRRLALSRLVLTPRPIWLLDEPTVGLDATSLALLTELIATHLRGGGIAIVASHTPLDVSLHHHLDMSRFSAEP
ncbi:heme ABC exporter ATP-binding protein CcmA [Rhodoligotrophos defluvii]|uniref:heme ABC exporter ATP-binding protein CcmA n=1 Tax=Rhodoligotrophos defluvii TaxID=2561934 RepID=UPI0010C9EFA0|nr:heme ABC exporter ATP-binding protein CcmA [Rhodoligotrophos defluvii]